MDVSHLAATIDSQRVESPGIFPPSGEWRVGVANTAHRLVELSLREPDAAKYLRGVAKIAASVTDPAANVLIQQSSQSGGSPRIELLHGTARSFSQNLFREFIALAKECGELGTCIVRSVQRDPSVTCTAIPIPVHLGMCLLVIGGQRPTSDVHVAIWQLAASHIANRHLADDRRRAEALSHEVAAITELVTRIQATRDVTRGCQVLVDNLAEFLKCRQVIAAICPPHKTECRVMAVSGTETINSQSDDLRLAHAALRESIVRGELSAWPVSNDMQRYALLAHRNYASHAKVTAIVTCPLRTEQGDLVGALLLAADDAGFQRPEIHNFLRAIEGPLATTIRLLEASRPGKLQTVLRACGQFVRERRGRVVVAAALAGCGILLIPVRYDVKCECVLQPVVRRYVASPFDGLLDRSFVRAGDVVVQDQLLARMDDREIQWELAGVRADLHRATKEREGHVATHEFGKSEIARHEIDRLSARRQLLENRAKNLEVRSPIDGVIVSGDLDKAQGIALNIGKTLFEIAPLDHMVVELAVPEDDIPYVASGMRVRLRLDAFPGNKFTANLERIHPRSELREHQNVFIGEVSLANAQHTLRPGMRGKAKIATASHPLAWNLFHRAWAAVIQWVGW
jgi:hypothetical protein